MDYHTAVKELPKTITDYAGRSIELTVGQWSHINVGHSEHLEDGLWPAMVETIEDPDIVKRHGNAASPEREVMYRRVTSAGYSPKFMTAVICGYPMDGTPYVATAYPVLKEGGHDGEVIYKRS